MQQKCLGIQTSLVPSTWHPHPELSCSLLNILPISQDDCFFVLWFYPIILPHQLFTSLHALPALSLNKLWGFVLLITLLPLYFESVTLHSASPPRHLSVQASVLYSLPDILPCQMQHDQNGTPYISHQNDFLSIRVVGMAAVECLIQCLQRRMLKKGLQTSSPKH